jgi:large subunit ribosomal protein L24
MARKRATPRVKRPALKIRKGDRVQVISGKDRGKSGRVLRVEPAKQRLYVEGLNMNKRHMKPKEGRSGGGQEVGQQFGGVIDMEGPIHVSNVMIVDAKGTPTRVGVERNGGERVRVARKTGARLE